MYCLPTTYEGMKGAIGWYVGGVIVGRFDTEYAASVARQKADPSYKPKPFADKDFSKPKKTDAEIFADYCAKIRARRTSKS